LRALAIADDRFYAPRAPVEALVAMYPRTRSEVRVVARAETGPIGHFGFFKEIHREGLWRRALAWMEETGGFGSEQV
jgi:predicted alpha/beta hydrolase